MIPPRLKFLDASSRKDASKTIVFASAQDCFCRDLTRAVLFSNMVTNINTEHLQQVPSPFASTTDLVVVVASGQDTIEFPVHAVILSSRSEILQDIIQVLKPTESDAMLKLQIYDDAAAVQSVLDCLYMPCADASRCERKPDLIRTQLPRVMLLAHKYKMHTLLADVTSALTALFQQAFAHDDPTQRITIPDQDDLVFVVEIAAAADACQRRLLLSHCEMYLINHFNRLKTVLACKLPSASLVRIANGLEHCHNQHLLRKQDEARGAASRLDQKACPYCSDGQIGRYKSRHNGSPARCSSCLWPYKTDTMSKDVFARQSATLMTLLDRWSVIDPKE